MTQIFLKDPNEVLDYTIDWEEWLDSDTISTSNWTVATGITQDSASNTATTATIWLSGGTASIRYTATNRIVTAAGRTADRTIYLDILDR